MLAQLGGVHWRAVLAQICGGGDYESAKLQQRSGNERGAIGQLKCASYDDIHRVGHEIDQVILQSEVDCKIAMPCEQRVKSWHDVYEPEGDGHADGKHTPSFLGFAHFGARSLDICEDTDAVLVPALSSLRESQAPRGSNDQRNTEVCLE